MRYLTANDEVCGAIVLPDLSQLKDDLIAPAEHKYTNTHTCSVTATISSALRMLGRTKNPDPDHASMHPACTRRQCVLSDRGQCFQRRRACVRLCLPKSIRRTVFVVVSEHRRGVAAWAAWTLRWTLCQSADTLPLSC